MADFWCVNFDGEAGPLGDQLREYVLVHGLEDNLWLMHYQYSHNGHTYQGHPRQIAATTTNWRVAGKIKPGDWLVAYLPNNRFFAIGQVIKRKNRGRHLNQQPQQDTIGRTTAEHSHIYLKGIVHYADAGALYEDFTDTWNLPLTNSYSNLPEVWQYPQRIDVKKWVNIVASGVQVKGLAEAAPFPEYRRAAFEIPESFFEEIKMGLEQGAEE